MRRSPGCAQPSASLAVQGASVSTAESRVQPLSFLPGSQLSWRARLREGFDSQHTEWRRGERRDAVATSVDSDRQGNMTLSSA